MSKIVFYKDALGKVEDIDAYLLSESGLPGPRGNIELAQAVADWGDEALFEHLLSFKPDVAPVNSPYELLAFGRNIIRFNYPMRLTASTMFASFW
ncbi:hypothetical protein [Methanocella paludicola]|nr:hypothetical protein [Methanocella paludicola]